MAGQHLRDCPPGDALPLRGRFYRFVSGSLPLGAVAGEEDWLLPVHKRLGECAGAVDRCECYAHSVFADRQDLVKAKAVIPAFRRKAIAEVEIRESDGTGKASPSPLGPSHHDWWTREDYLPESSVVMARDD